MNRMRDFRDLLQGDSADGDLLGEIVGADLLGEMDGDLVGRAWGKFQAGRPLSAMETMQLRQLLRNQLQGSLQVRNSPPLLNRVPGVPQTTQSRAFLPFQTTGGAPVASFGPGTDQRVTFLSRPQRPIRLHRLVATKASSVSPDPTNAVITEFKVGQTSLLAGSGGVPLDMFRPEVMNSAFDGVSSGPGVDLVIEITLIGTIPAAQSQTVSIGAYADQLI